MSRGRQARLPWGWKLSRKLSEVEKKSTLPLFPPGLTQVRQLYEQVESLIPSDRHRNWALAGTR